MSTALLDVQELSAAYGQIPALRGISVRVGEDESIGLLGPNGHGKTTLLRVISGLQRASAGQVSWCDTPITNEPAHRIVERGLIHVAQATRLFPQCTIAESLRLGAYSRRARPQERERLDIVHSLFPKLRERSRQTCGTLSGGERQMVAIAVGLMACPRLLMLDEPTLGLAPSVKDELFAAIDQIRKSGVSLIVVDGDLEFMLGLTDRWYAVLSGRVTYEADTSTRVDPQEVMRMYFGAAGSPNDR